MFSCIYWWYTWNLHLETRMLKVSCGRHAGFGESYEPHHGETSTLVSVRSDCGHLYAVTVWSWTLHYWVQTLRLYWVHKLKSTFFIELQSLKPLENTKFTLGRSCKLLFLFVNQSICCGYSKEPSQWDGSFEHPKHMFRRMFACVDIRSLCSTISNWCVLQSMWGYIFYSPIP